MAILTFLISLAARKVNSVLQAIFGWSVTALFGRLQRRAQILVTGAVIVSLLWPIFIVGVFAPHVAVWVIAFVPFHSHFDDGALRLIWIALAIVAPLFVGLVVRLATPTVHDKMPLALLRGYPIALGFAVAFLVVVITVPILKIASIVRRWSDEHVYVQPHDGAYDRVLEELVDACRRAGLQPETTDAPRLMVLATTIMRAMAGGAVNPFVSTTLRRVTAAGIELYLYPGDLLMRGMPATVSHVRAMLCRTQLDADAYLVDSDAAKAIQDELSQIAKHLAGGAEAEKQLREVYRRLLGLDVTFEEWSVLDGIARKLERELITGRLRADTTWPLDAVADEISARTSARRAA